MSNLIGSPRFSLNSYDWWKILRDGLTIVAGAALTWAAEVLVPDLQKHDVISLMVSTFIITTLVAVRRFLTDSTPKLNG